MSNVLLQNVKSGRCFQEANRIYMKKNEENMMALLDGRITEAK